MKCKACGVPRVLTKGLGLCSDCVRRCGSHVDYAACHDGCERAAREFKLSMKRLVGVEPTDEVMDYVVHLYFTAWGDSRTYAAHELARLTQPRRVP